MWGTQTAGNIRGIPGLSACPRASAAITQQSGTLEAALLESNVAFLCDFPAFMGTPRAVAWKESQSLAVPLEL